jgi:hypothetical protein
MRRCECSECAGRLVSANVWTSHQKPVSSLPGVAVSNTLPSHPHPHPHPDLVDVSELPNSFLFDEDVSSDSTSKALAKALKRNTKRERNNRTRRAAVGLEICIKKADEITNKLLSVESYEELDRLLLLVDGLYEQSGSISRRTTNLDLLRDKLHYKLGLVGALVHDAQRKLGERTIPISFDNSKVFFNTFKVFY